MTTLSGREFKRDIGWAKREAERAPVIITDRGKPSYVLLSIEHYRRLAETGEEWVRGLQMEEDIDFEPHRMDFESRVADL